MNEAKRSLENARWPDESYEDYVVRRRRINKFLKVRLRKKGYHYKHSGQGKRQPYMTPEVKAAYEAKFK